MSSKRTEQALAKLADLTPKQIVAELDRYIVGQQDAKKSVAIAVTIQPREKTLTDQEIDAAAAKIVTEVNKKTGGVLR